MEFTYAIILVIVLIIVIYFAYVDLWKKYVNKRKKELLLKYIVWTKEMILYNYYPPKDLFYLSKKKKLLSDLEWYGIDLYDYTNQLLKLNDAVFVGNKKMIEEEMEELLEDFDDLRLFSKLSYLDMITYKTKQYNRNSQVFNRRLQIGVKLLI